MYPYSDVEYGKSDFSQLLIALLFFIRFSSISFPHLIDLASRVPVPGEVDVMIPDVVRPIPATNDEVVIQVPPSMNPTVRLSPLPRQFPVREDPRRSKMCVAYVVDDSPAEKSDSDDETYEPPG